MKRSTLLLHLEAILMLCLLVSERSEMNSFQSQHLVQHLNRVLKFGRGSRGREVREERVTAGELGELRERRGGKSRIRFFFGGRSWGDRRRGSF